MFRRVNVLEAAVKTAILFTPASLARSNPRSFGTNAEYTTPGVRVIFRNTSSESASCGIARGDTKDPTSISPTPVPDSAFTNNTLSSVEMMAGSFWSPSRGPTSIIRIGREAVLCPSFRDILRSPKVRQAGPANSPTDDAEIKNPGEVSFFFLDGDEHRKRRAAVAGLFAPKTIVTRHQAVMTRTMDEIVARAMQKWPDVPNVYRWLRLDRRGNWLVKGRARAADGTPVFERIGKIAWLMLAGKPRTLTDEALYFHATSVRPAWSRTFVRTTKIGRHIFYRPKVRLTQGVSRG